MLKQIVNRFIVGLFGMHVYHLNHVSVGIIMAPVVMSAIVLIVFFYFKNDIENTLLLKRKPYLTHTKSSQYFEYLSDIDANSHVSTMVVSTLWYEYVKRLPRP